MHRRDRGWSEALSFARAAGVLLAWTVVQAVLACGLLAMCMRFVAVDADGLFASQAWCVLACMAYLAILCSANLLVPDDPRVDPPAGSHQAAGAAATAYMSVVTFGVLLAMHRWLGPTLFLAAWFWTVAFSAPRVKRLVGHALGCRLP